MRRLGGMGSGFRVGGGALSVGSPCCFGKDLSHAAAEDNFEYCIPPPPLF